MASEIGKSSRLSFNFLHDYMFSSWIAITKVDDTNPSISFTGQLTDVSQVKKFELSDQGYADRRGRWPYIVTVERSMSNGS